MRKLAILEHMTLDGFASSGEGQGFEWTWPGMGPDIFEFTPKVLADVGTAMYGRETYLGMQEYWAPVRENPDAAPGEREHADWVHDIDKIVFSTTLPSADWHNSRLISENVAEQVNALKQQDGGTMLIFASPKLVHSFAAMDLIDEYRIFVHPVMIGGGTRLFADDKKTTSLKLTESRSFTTGVTFLRYENA